MTGRLAVCPLIAARPVLVVLQALPARDRGLSRGACARAAARGIWRCIGFLYAQEQEPARAIEALAEAVRLAPDDADTRFNLGFLYHERGDLDRAVIEFREAIRLRPMLDRAWYGLGVIYLRRGELGPAIEHLQEAAKQQYFNPHAGHELAIAYHRAGEQAKALAEQKRVDGFDPKMGARIAHDIGLR